MTPVAVALAKWAHDLQPTADDLAPADRSLLDTVAVMLAARDHPVTAGLPAFRSRPGGQLLGMSLITTTFTWPRPRIQRGLHPYITRHGRRATGPPSGSRRYGAARIDPRLAALLSGMARYVYSRSPGQCRRSGGGARAACRPDRYCHGAGHPRRRWGAAHVWYRCQVTSGRFRCRCRDRAALLAAAGLAPISPHWMYRGLRSSVPTEPTLTSPARLCQAAWLSNYP